MTKPAQIDRLLEIMARLRNPDGGCPWDLEQDFETLTPYAVEEAYEVADAVARGDMENFREELGDLLLQVVFQSQMARERGLFTFDDVARSISDKMVSRHPHVFGDKSVHTADAVLAQWDDIKLKEKAAKPSAQQSILDDVPVNFPALMRAQKLQKRAAKVGFDWPETAHVLDKMQEEIEELKAELRSGDTAKIEEELGDLFFVLVNFGRKLGIDCETALTKCNQKFYRRFNGIEKEVKAKSKEMADCSLEELEAIWVEQKQKEKAA